MLGLGDIQRSVLNSTQEWSPVLELLCLSFARIATLNWNHTTVRRTVRVVKKIFNWKHVAQSAINHSKYSRLVARWIISVSMAMG